MIAVPDTSSTHAGAQPSMFTMPRVLLSGLRRSIHYMFAITWAATSAIATSSGHVAAQGAADEKMQYRQAGERLFQHQCAACHLGAVPEAPRQQALALYTPERIVEALTSGVMSTQGIPLSYEQKQQ